ncbi:uncharacterized protein LOC134189474 [Corticium candelabrum]|uniref:uncharacterized protein LOC134189474 n=1 Tax=Corticium candelabrum TaxID=121492 RepID=UPI002E27539F|nr:uncharacterized protein LOC134189474 [Corticium candelabrum]
MRLSVHVVSIMLHFLLDASLSTESTAPTITESPIANSVVLESVSRSTTTRGGMQCLQGLPGRDGVQGNPGVPGFNGRNGLPGSLGNKGEKGDCDDRRGATGAKGDKGDDGVKGERGLTGSQGPQGKAGNVEAQFGTSIINWNQCSFQNWRDGKDHGVLKECTIQKFSDETSLRLTWSGNIRLTGCTSCCMRWYFTVNGLECNNPVDGNIYQQQNLNIYRISTFSGYCRHVGGLPLFSGEQKVQLNVGHCTGWSSSTVYDAYTGRYSTSRIIIEEIAPVMTRPSLPPASHTAHIYQPNWKQCTWNSKNFGGNFGYFGHCTFRKMYDDTWLKITYDGNLYNYRYTSGTWFFSIDGSECTVPDKINAQFYQGSTFDYRFPATITGYCKNSGGRQIKKGLHNIIFSIHKGGDGYSTLTCWNSVCRIVIEEVPPPANAGSNQKTGEAAIAYNPRWQQYSWWCFTDGRDNGLIKEVIFTKEQNETSLRVTWNGNLRLYGCTSCCRRWYFTIDGVECSAPQRIEGIVYQSNNINLHKTATIDGICMSALRSGSYTLDSGPRRIQFRVGKCSGHSTTRDAYTGYWNTVSRITVEELPLSKAVVPANSIGFIPNYKQCAYGPLNDGKDHGVIIECPFVKRETRNYLRLTFEGSMRLSSCSGCCMRWYFTVDGAECTVPAAIDSVVYIGNSYYHHRQGTVSGLCGGIGSQARTLDKGRRVVQLRVGRCNGYSTYDAYTGYYSSSRVIVEELPPPQP